MFTVPTNYATTRASVESNAKNKVPYTVLSGPQSFKHCYYPLVDILDRSRPWFSDLRHKKCKLIHPVISKVLLTDAYLQHVNDWREMVLEWPYVAEMDPTRLAYTRSDQDGRNDRQTVTTIGKFLKRHAPGMPDHLLRDLAALANSNNCYQVNTAPEMVHAVQTGPSSCMQDSDWSEEDHPYNVYNPSYGWSMALRGSPDNIQGRCLCLEHQGKKVFVRSYKKEEGERYSGVDQTLEAWLIDQGYTKLQGWPTGARVERIRINGDYVMPYVDGNNHMLDDHGDYLVITKNGEIEARNTNGMASEVDLYSCEDCGERVSQDDISSVGYHGETLVCEHCLENEYTYCTGRNGDRYYVPNREASEVDGEYYDNDYLAENDIVELANGDLAHINNTVYIESSCEYYHCDDEGQEFVRTAQEYEGTDYHLIADCFECEVSGKWYHCDDVSSEIDAQGRTVHPDYYTTEEAA